MTRPGSFSALDKTNELMVDENDCKFQLQNFSQSIKNLGKLLLAIIDIVSISFNKIF
jgi:hypothetical protein